MCIKVDLPDPDGPTIATNSPWRIDRETSWSTVTGMLPVWYVFIIFSQTIIRLNDYTPKSALSSPDHLEYATHRVTLLASPSAAGLGSVGAADRLGHHQVTLGEPVGDLDHRIAARSDRDCGTLGCAIDENLDEAAACRRLDRAGWYQEYVLF